MCVFEEDLSVVRLLTAHPLPTSGPIVGDTKYGGSATFDGVVSSLALHCRTISLLVRYFVSTISNDT